MSRALIVKGADFSLNAVSRINQNLPYDAEVAYLMSDGTAYIDTGIANTDSVRFNIKIAITSTSSANVFGCSDGTNRIGIVINNSTNKTNCRWGTSLDDLNSTLSVGEYTLTNIPEGNVFHLNEESLTLTANTFSTSKIIHLFGMNSQSGSNSSTPDNVKLIYAKFYNGSTKVLDLIPVRVGQVGYLYDKVSEELFANAAESGALVIGADK